MPTGRRPKPTVVKLAAGNPGKRALPKDEPCPTTELPKTAPKIWSASARKEYARIKKALDELGAVTGPDLEGVRFYCEAAADHTAACDALEFADSESGRFYPVTTKDGGEMWRAHPALAAKADAEKRCKSWLVEHGLTPSARTRVSAVKKEAPKSKADKYIRGRRA